MSSSFDFEQHRVNALKEYGALRANYAKFAAAIEGILRMALRDIAVHNISARAKDLERFALKASKPDPADLSRPKYSEPMSQIEDIAGARIITYVLRTLSEVEKVVHREFEVIERSDKGQKLIENALVGYRSIHLIVGMKPDRVKLLEYQEFKDLRAEVQIRTILQHTWAEIEHDMRYKPMFEPNKELNQRFTALAGLIEVGDREFDQIYDMYERRRKALLDLAQIDESRFEGGDSNRSKRRLDDILALPMAILVEESSAKRIEPTDQSPRELIARGKYADAVVRYTALIEREPRQFFNYLGRAKARFLSGDAEGGLVDLEGAEELSPNHPSIARLRDLIEGRSPDKEHASDLSLALRQGHTALREGNAIDALRKYEEAERLGFSPVYSIFNRSMAQFLGKKFALSRQTLDRINPYPRTALGLNVMILEALCYLMSGGDKQDEVLQMLSDYLAQLRESMGFQYAKSPISNLEQGVRKVFPAEEALSIEPVFDLLHQESANAEPSKAAEGDVVSENIEAIES